MIVSMEKLTIDNFLVLSKVDIPIKKINIVIGPQSVGKSIIAKILYFIYTIPSEIREGIFEGSNEKEIFDGHILSHGGNSIYTSKAETEYCARCS